MSNGSANGSDYRIARQRIAYALIALVVVYLLADTFGFSQRPADPLILAGIFMTAAGLLSVDIPGLRR